MTFYGCSGSAAATTSSPRSSTCRSTRSPGSCGSRSSSARSSRSSIARRSASRCSGADADRLLHGYETGVIVRSPGVRTPRCTCRSRQRGRTPSPARDRDQSCRSPSGGRERRREPQRADAAAARQAVGLLVRRATPDADPRGARGGLAPRRRRARGRGAGGRPRRRTCARPARHRGWRAQEALASGRATTKPRTGQVRGFVMAAQGRGRRTPLACRRRARARAQPRTTLRTGPCATWTTCCGPPYSRSRVPLSSTRTTSARIRALRTSIPSIWLAWTRSAQTGDETSHAPCNQKRGVGWSRAR